MAAGVADQLLSLRTPGSHLLLLRKRAVPRTRPTDVFMGRSAMVAVDGDRVRTAWARLVSAPEKVTLEDLAYVFKTDKSHDDHKYTDVYAALLDERRGDIRNVTEVGVMFGQSMLLWHAFLPSAHVWGFDNYVRSAVRNLLASYGPRMHYHFADSLTRRAYATAERTPALALANASMDLIIDDGAHKPDTNERTLANFWPLLSAGGVYVIEDVVTGGNDKGQFNGDTTSWSASGASMLAHDARYKLNPIAEQVLRDHPAVLVNPTIGHRALGQFKRAVPGKWFRDETDHNTHLLVIHNKPKRVRDRLT